MTKKQPTQNAYLVNGYVVVLEKLKNDRNGNPRYKAFITALEEVTAQKRTGAYTHVYTFQGSYAGERPSAEQIVAYHLSKED